MLLSTLLGEGGGGGVVSARKTVKIQKPCGEIGQSFEQSLQGGKLL